MRIINVHTVERVITIFTIGLVMAITGILFYFLSLRLGDVARQNQAYNRYIACVLSVPPSDRDTKKIDRCWVEAQKDTGIEVKRYDHQSLE